MRIRKPLLLLFCTLTFMVLLPAVSACSFPTSKDITVYDETELIDAISKAANNKNRNIELGDDIVLSVEFFTIPDKKVITLTGNKSLIGRDESYTVWVGGTLNIDGITVTHMDGSIGSGVTINEGGVLNLVSGVIKGNNDQRTYGGGVHNRGTFNMYGGEISGNSAQYGGGVDNSFFGGMFNFYDGKICDNTAAKAYGGGVQSSCLFRMFGGEITDNIGDGVYIYDGIFELSGGKISYNTLGGVNVGGTINNPKNAFTMSGGEISNNTGSGVILSANPNCLNSFVMTGGIICGNKTESYGGGISCYPNRGVSITITNGEISNNSATYGGGIWIDVRQLSNLTISPGVVFLTLPQS